MPTVVVSTYNPDNSNLLPKVGEIEKPPNLENITNCQRQPSYLKRLLCFSNFLTIKPTFKTAICGKSCFCYNNLIDVELFKFKN